MDCRAFSLLLLEVGGCYRGFVRLLSGFVAFWMTVLWGEVEDGR